MREEAQQWSPGGGQEHPREVRHQAPAVCSIVSLNFTHKTFTRKIIRLCKDIQDSNRQAVNPKCTAPGQVLMKLALLRTCCMPGPDSTT